MPVQTKIPRGKFFVEDRVNAKGEATIYIRYFLQRYAKRSTCWASSIRIISVACSKK